MSITQESSVIPSNYKDYIYRFTYYLLSPFAPFISKKISPNHITVSAFFCAMLGTGLLFFITTPTAYLDWIVFTLLWFILDALDGMHARLSGQSSEYGAFLDHALDNIYFIFMFTVFIYKFDLLHMLYVYIIILRITASLMVFTVQCHTKILYLDKFSGGTEFVLFSTVMLLSYFYPHFNLAAHIKNTLLLQYVTALHLQQHVFMKLTLLIYFIAVPINMVLQFQLVKRFALQ